MPYYIARVELHNASSEDYETLHANMQRGGFSRNILGQNGSLYKMPTAEYAMQVAALGDIDNVRDYIKTLIPNNIPYYWVFVSGATTHAFWLNPAN